MSIGQCHAEFISIFFFGLHCFEYTRAESDTVIGNIHIQNHMRQEHSQSARKQRIALYNLSMIYSHRVTVVLLAFSTILCTEFQFPHSPPLNAIMAHFSFPKIMLKLLVM